MENQCLGLAEAVGADIVVKRIALRAPWRQLSPWLPFSRRWGLAQSSDCLEPPWPDLVIGSGRAAVGPALAIRRAAAGGTPSPSVQTRCVHIQNPGVDFARFDLVLLPWHDGKRAANVVLTKGALHRVTADRLAAEAQRMAPQVAGLPAPRLAVLIGGGNAVYRLTASAVDGIAGQLVALTDLGFSLLVTPSRRTGADNADRLRQALAGRAAVVWDGAGDNPYYAYLGLADAILCTVDSVSMISEAASTGKPVYLLDLPGGSAKFRRFHELMYEEGMCHPFAGVIDLCRHPPLDDMPRAVAAVRALWPSA